MSDEIHKVYVKKKLFGVGGLKLRSYCKMCDNLAWREVKNVRFSRVQLTAKRRIAKELLPFDKEIMQKRLCPANAILFYSNVTFGRGRWAQTYLTVDWGIVKDVPTEKTITLTNGRRVARNAVIAWGIPK